MTHVFLKKDKDGATADGLCAVCNMAEVASIHQDPTRFINADERKHEPGTLAIRPNYYKVETKLRNHGNEVKTVECWDLIESLGLNFYLGDALAYLWRLGRKTGATKREDIRKTITYLNAELARMDRDGEP